MKKLITTVLTILSCGAAYALPLGNPSEASLTCDGIFWEGMCTDFCDPCVNWCDAWSIRAGFYGDYVFNRHLEGDSGPFKDNDVSVFEVYTNAAYLALNFFDRVDLFATLGATRLRLDADEFGIAIGGGGGAGPVPGIRVIAEADADFSWSVGGRASLFELGCWTLGLEGQYFRTKPNFSRSWSGAGTGSTVSLNNDITYSEWQVGLGLSYRIWNIVPYIGGKWSRARVDFNNLTFNAPVTPPGTPPLFTTFQFGEFDSRSHGGYVIGASFVDCEKMSLTAEARFPDEKAVYVNGQIRF